MVNSPGGLAKGFGSEFTTNMYRGGTIFHDAASNDIHVQNQISLDAGKTVVAKQAFEYWLWEQAQVFVQDYHSNNGIFTAELFKESCIEGGQFNLLVKLVHCIKTLRPNMTFKQ